MSPMDPWFAPEPSSHSHYSAPSPNYNEQASRSQAEALLGNIQSNGSEGLNTRESSLHPSHPSSLYGKPFLSEGRLALQQRADSGPEYRTIIYPVPNVPNHQLRLCDGSFLPIEGMPCLYLRVCLIEESLNTPAMTALVSLGLTRDQVPDLPFPTDRNDADTFHDAYAQYPFPASLRGANRPIKQAEIENHHPLSPLRDIYGGHGVSASPESSSSMIANASSSSTELYAQSRMQDDYVGATSFPRGQVDSTTLGATTQRQSAATRKTFWKRQQKQRKNERDKVRKRIQRSDDDQYFAMICELLDIPLGPKNTLVRRSEYLCIHLFRLKGLSVS